MEARLSGNGYAVKVADDELAKFINSWPCSGLDYGASYEFVFSRPTGDLVDMTITRADGSQDTGDDDDGPALAALSEDAGRYGAENLELEDVMSVRFSQKPGM